jgi:ABC-type Fe3+/spermidine/putrescine transport system ATPase subunit
VNLNIQRGELIALLGPSGCGKTTTLRALAGFVALDSGRVYIKGRDITDTPAHKRNMALVFQNYALFPHMTIHENIAFGLKRHNVPKSEIPERVESVLERVRLPGMEDRYPHQLSGGQQQRVALARALVIDPEVLLLDEPLSNLDAKLRIDMRLEIREIVKDAGSTAVYVTHDQEEALSITDRIVVMDQGRVVQDGSPREVYEAPRAHFVANFIGNANILEGTVVSADDQQYRLRTPTGLEIDAMGWPDSHSPGDEAAVSIRHENIRLTRSGAALAKGRIMALSYVGALTDYVVRLSTGETIKAIIPSGESDCARGDDVNVTWDINRVRIITL